MNVLFVGAGKRFEMAQKFITSGWTVDSYEFDVNCPINKLNVTILPGKKWNDPSLEKELLKYFCEYDLVLPFQDEAAKILSKLKTENAINNICVSPLATTQVCLNKCLFENQFFQKFYYPKPLIGKPAVIKPQNGFGSKGIYFQEEWSGVQTDNFVTQRKIQGGIEYSLDCYFDKLGNLIDYVPRKRLEVTGGEVTKSVTVCKDLLNFDAIIKDISNALVFTGPICVQLISDSNDNLWLMEINARFGGGCTLSIASGFDILSLLKEEYVNNKKISGYQTRWKSDVHLSRCFVDYYYEKNCF